MNDITPTPLFLKSSNFPTRKEDLALLKVAAEIIQNSESNVKDVETGIWNTLLKSGVFVSAYRTAGNPVSANVWCCMSNGSYGTENTVLTM